jgi:hypothetical protein
LKAIAFFRRGHAHVHVDRHFIYLLVETADGDAFHRREVAAWRDEATDRTAAAVGAVRAAAARQERCVALPKKMLDRLIENSLIV